MFARQVDPLAEMTSAINAAEMQHRASQEAFDNDHSNHLFSRQSSIRHPFNATSHGIDINKTPSHSSHPCKRKHAIHFEPEFFAALDSSIGDDSDSGINYNKHNHNNGSNSNIQYNGPSRIRSSWSSSSTKPPLKKMKRSTYSSNNSNNSNIQGHMPLPKVSMSQPTSSNIRSAYGPTFPNNPVPTAKESFKQRQRQQQQQFPKATSWIHMSHKNILHKDNLTEPFRQGSAGPCIIDLSSGEELVALHLGNNDNKRGRDNDDEPMSPTELTSSPKEVFEYQEDGNLLPIRDYIPTQPSPAKKFRLTKCSQQSSLRFLSDSESDMEREGSIKIKRQKDQRSSGVCRLYHRTKLQRRNGGSDTAWRKKSVFSQGHGNYNSAIHNRRYEVDDASGMYDSDGPFELLTRESLKEPICQVEIIQSNMTEDEPLSKTGKNEVALLPKPKLYSLSKGMRDLDWSKWGDIGTGDIFFVEQVIGNELVLYNGKRSSAPDKTIEDIYGHNQGAIGAVPEDSQSSVIIQELDDDDGYEDDGNFADDEACELSDDGPLVELEEKIMDMDLD